MSGQMGQSRGTVDEGFTLQLPLSLPLCSKHTLVPPQKRKKKSLLALFVCMSAEGLFVQQLPWHQVGLSESA